MSKAFIVLATVFLFGSGICKIQRKETGKFPVRNLQSQIHLSAKEQQRKLIGDKLVVGTFDWPPVVVEVGEKEGYFKGRDIHAVRAYASSVGKEILFKPTANNERFGVPIDGGKDYTGLIGDVIHGRVDIGVVNLYIISEYTKVADFVFPYHFDCISIAVPPALPVPPITKLIDPLTGTSWAAFGSLAFVGGFLINGMARLYQKAMRRSSGIFDNLSLSLTYNVNILTSVDTFDDTSRSPVRLLISFLWLTYFLITVVYRAALTSSLASPKTALPIDTIEQLSESGLKMFKNSDLALYKVFAQASDIHLRKVFSDVERNYNTHAVLKEVVQHNAALVTNRQQLQYLQRRNYTSSEGRPRFHIMNVCLATMQVGSYVPKKSPLPPILSKVSMRLAQSGLVEYWKRGTQPTLVPKAESDTPHFSLGDLQGAFYIWIFGASMSIFGLVIELVIKRYFPLV